MTGATVQQLFRYPVKSMMGEALDTVEVGTSGLVGDRIWAVRDEKRGGIRGGKKIPQLMTLSAHTCTPAPTIVAPDGESALVNEDRIHDWLSEKLDHPVTIWPLVPADQLDHYRRGAPDTDDFEEELRTVFGRLPAEPIPDLTGFEALLEFESPPGTYFDAFPISIMSRQSLETMNQLTPDSDFDVRRFRPNVLLYVPDSAHPFPEQEWLGATLTIGEVTLKVESTCPRCSMTTHGFADLPRDTNIMRQLVGNSEGNLGIYATVLSAGALAVGDAVTVQ